MAAPSLEAARERFQVALQEKNFGSRCHLLSSLGKELGVLEQPELEERLDGLTGTPPHEGLAFTELGRLIVAKAAKCRGYARRLLDHPSRAVRFEAVRGGLLRPEEAREAFLSADSSYGLKKLLVGCKALPCDHKVMEHAWQLFGAREKELVWEMMTRVTDEGLLRSWLLEHEREELTEWLGERINSRPCHSPPGLPALARRFPQVLVDLVKQGTLKWGWFWTKDVLSADPTLVLKTTFLEGHRRGSGPRKGYDPRGIRQRGDETLASWGWRHQPEVMLEICRERAEAEHRSDDTAGFTVVELAEWLMEASSTRWYLTTSQKLSHLTSIWSLIPVVHKTADVAQSFEKLLPTGLKAPRTKDLEQLVNAFWKIISDLGRLPRKEILVGGACLKSFLKKLPVPLAVEQFFRILEEFEADTPVYQFVQSDLCKSDKGTHDGLILRVFKRYLQKDALTAAQAAAMFQVLLSDARTMDVIQEAFNLLLQRLDQKMDCKLTAKVVSKMGQLEKDARLSDGVKAPKATLPVPVEWVHLVQLPKGSRSHVNFLLHVLHTKRDSGTELLGVMLGKYGPCFFWDVLGHVLASLLPGGLQQLEPPPPDMALFKKLDISSILVPLQQPGTSTDAPSGSSEVPQSRYFTTVVDLKKKTLGKDPAQRSAGYTELMTVAQKEHGQDCQKAFEDLLPFLVGRFSGEQDSVRSSLLKDLLKTPLLPFKLWGDMLPHLMQLWKISSKSRRAGDSSSDSRIWAAAGVQLVEQAIRDWTDEMEPNAACAFGLELAPDVDLPEMFVKLRKECEEGKSLSDAAARWVFERAVPLTSDTEIPVSVFWATLKTLAATVEAKEGAERALWERWPFVAERWRTLLAPGIAQKAMRFALVSAVRVLTERCQEMAKRNDDGEIVELWWEPLECAEYREAVGKVLRQMESGDIPAKEAAALLAARVEALTQKDHEGNRNWAVRGRKRRSRLEQGSMPKPEERMWAKPWVEHQRWDVPKHHSYTPLPWDTMRCSDALATEELRTFSRLLSSGQAQRQVLWQVVTVAAMLAGPVISGLLEEAIAVLDARFEGMARCVGRHYPYLNAALTKNETQSDSSDVLTPLLEFWLFDDASRDRNVAKLMDRQDCEYFLFFGTSFARHVSNTRQEWLHRCLQRLHAPGAGNPEFYHFPRRGPMLHQVAQLGSGRPGWRSSLKGLKPACKQALSMDSRRARIVERQILYERKRRFLSGGRWRRMPPPVPVTRNGIVGSVQVHLWHADTQAEFLQKALSSTEMDVLALMTRMDFADGVGHADNVLKSFPKEQSVKQSSSDIWGWEVIQAAGAYSNLKDEVERRFLEQPAPWARDAVADAELDALLCALGRADNALQAVGVLGRYAGKVKRVVKESVTKLIVQVKPSGARDIISNIMLPRKSGVGLQVAGLRKIAQLQVPDPLELYHKAWSNGKCPRDVAGIILAKVNTAQSFSPEDVRGFFDFFSQMAGQQDECCYVAGLLLDQLIESPAWSLPFLPEVVSKLAMLPGMASKAMTALRSSTSHPSEVIKALTDVLRAARVAKRVQPSVAKESPEAQTLTELTSLIDFSRVVGLTSGLTRLPLVKCDAPVLLGFVDQVLRSWQDAARESDKQADNLLSGALVIWVKLLRAREMASWPDVLGAMEGRLVRQLPGGKCGTKMEKAESRPQNLQAMAKAVADHIAGMGLTPQKREQALAIVGDSFQRLMDKHLKESKDETEEADSAFDEEAAARQLVAENIFVKSWASLLAHGCPRAESARLFARCSGNLRVKLARRIISVAVEDIKEKVASRAQWRQKRPEQGWKRTSGIAVEDVKVGSTVNGVVTNSSAQHGVFFNFGCVKDGKLNVPTADWKKYHVGDEVRGMIVNSVDIKEKNQFIELILVGEAGKTEGGALEARDMAHRTLAWLATPIEQRHLHFSTLAELWASIIALERDGSGFEAALELLGTPPPPASSCVRAVVELLEKKPAKSIMRPALAWLGRVSPEDAVQLWPALLAPSASQQDVEALLTLCEAHGFEPPPLQKSVARSLTLPVLRSLAASSLPEARLLVVQALSEQHWSFNDLPPVLAELCKDPCEIVKVAARNLWVGLENSAEKASAKEPGKEEGQEEVEESDEEEDEDDDSDADDSDED